MGWPPIRSFRKNSLASTSKNNDEVEGKAVPGALFVKVSMDGAPYLRKVDLKNYSKYQELSSALEKMFSCFTIGESLLSFNLIQKDRGQVTYDVIYQGSIFCTLKLHVLVCMDQVTAVLI